MTDCTYVFGLSSPKAVVATARLLENTGVAAYLGAAGDISDPAYLAAAASILTIEARHASYLNEINGATGFPAAYDSGLNYAQVYSIAAPLIVPNSTFLPSCLGCCQAPACPVYVAHPCFRAKLTIPSLSACGAGALPSSIQVFPTLTWLTKTPRAGRKSAIKFTPKSGYSGDYYVAFIWGGKTQYAKVGEQQTVNVPKDLVGLICASISFLDLGPALLAQALSMLLCEWPSSTLTFAIRLPDAVVTTSSSALDNSNTVAGPGVFYLD